jgi:hypothetical protein
MRGRLFTLVAWLAAGHILIVGLAMWLLQVPESNAWMLALSLVIVMAVILLTGVVEHTAVLAAPGDVAFSAAVGRAVRGAWLIVYPLVVVGAFWWAGDAVQSWLNRHAGELDASLIATFGWTRSSGLHTALAWTVSFLRWGVGISLAVSLMTALAGAGLRAMFGRAWLGRALSWKQLLVVSAALWLGLWLPWQAVYWRPASLPPTWVQPAFAVLKLSVLFLMANAAWAVIVKTAARR